MVHRVARVPKAVRLVARAPARRSVATRAMDAVAGPYANGMIELAQERDLLEPVYNDLMGLKAVLNEKPEDGNANEVRNFILGNPLAQEQKKEVIETMAQKMEMQTETRDFLKLLIDVGRMDAILDIVDVYETRYNALTDTQVVKLRSAVKLEHGEEYEIAQQVQETTKSQNILIKPSVDEELIGGFVIEFGDSQVDLSIKGQLDRIERELLYSGSMA